MNPYLSTTTWCTFEVSTNIQFPYTKASNLDHLLYKPSNTSRTTTKVITPNHNSSCNPFQQVASSTLDIIEKYLILEQDKTQSLPKRFDPNIQLAGNYAPVQESPVQSNLEVVGEIPTGLQGVYLRNGANPFVIPNGGHHLFDGDGMIHAIKLGPGNKASYCCRFTETNRLVQERKLGRNVFPKPIGELHGRTGLLRLGLFYARDAIGLLDSKQGVGVANAGLVYFNGRVLAMSEDDLPYHIKITNIGLDHEDGDLVTIGRFDFEGQVNGPLIAHPKVDYNTGDFHTLSYNVIKYPYLKYLRFDKLGHKLCEVPVSLPQPTMVHDYAVTQNFVIIPDNQMVFKLSNMICNKSPLIFDPKKVARFGILSKDDVDGSGIRWIDVKNSFCFHFVNAWEETKDNGYKIIHLIGSRMSPPDYIFNDNDHDAIHINLCEILLNLETGESSQRVVVPGLNLEMGQVNKYILGKKARYVFMAIAEPWPKCCGIAKVDLETGEVCKFMFGEERYGGEPCFIPVRKSTNIEEDNGLREDEGWILNFVRDEHEGRSYLLILRSSDMNQVASVCIPSRVPYGFHGVFVDHDDIIMQTL